MTAPSSPPRSDVAVTTAAVLAEVHRALVLLNGETVPDLAQLDRLVIRWLQQQQAKGADAKTEFMAVLEAVEGLHYAVAKHHREAARKLSDHTNKRRAAVAYGRPSLGGNDGGSETTP